MKCEEYRVLIEDYVDGLLEHKAACARDFAHRDLRRVCELLSGA